MNQTLIDEIVTNVLARLQPSAVRAVSQPVVPTEKTQPLETVARTQVTVPASTSTPKTSPASKDVGVNKDAGLSIVELQHPVITANLLQDSVKAGQSVRIGRMSILTPAARDWFNSKRIDWTRQDRSGSTANQTRSHWRVIFQSITPTVRALQDGLRRTNDGPKMELVGQPMEAAAMAVSMITAAECDGVVIVTDHAEFVACKANRNEKVRAAVMHDSRQWEHAMKTFSANVVCISPLGRTFMELRTMLRDGAAANLRSTTGV